MYWSITEATSDDRTGWKWIFRTTRGLNKQTGRKSRFYLLKFYTEGILPWKLIFRNKRIIMEGFVFLGGFLLEFLCCPLYFTSWLTCGDAELTCTVPSDFCLRPAFLKRKWDWLVISSWWITLELMLFQQINYVFKILHRQQWLYCNWLPHTFTISQTHTHTHRVPSPHTVSCFQVH